jgi:sarcosine oxidase
VSERFDHVVVGLGALGSAAAYQLARRGRSVLGLEQFDLGHHRGASHDTSRILRHSYHTPEYVRLTQDAYDDWAQLSADAGRELVTVVGGLDLFPPEPAIPMVDYTAALSEVGVPFELLDVDQVGERWPQFALPAGTTGLFQERGAIVPAGPGTAAMQDLARRYGAVLRDRSPVASVTGTSVALADGTTYSCGSVVVCADAWTARLLAPLGIDLALTVTLEQATYFAPEHPEDFAPERMPLWIWMDDPSFYGFPCYGEPTVKAAQDCGGPVVDPDARGSDVSEEMLALLAGHMGSVLPGAGRPVRSLRCQYALTPDRDFVVDRVPGHPTVAIGLGAGHGFKFAPTFGRLLADLATGERERVSPTFALDRPALVDPAYSAHWLV